MEEEVRKQIAKANKEIGYPNGAMLLSKYLSQVTHARRLQNHNNLHIRNKIGPIKNKPNVRNNGNENTPPDLRSEGIRESSTVEIINVLADQSKME